MEDYLANLTDKELEMLRASFFTQAFDILEQLGQEVLRFEENPGDMEFLKNIQRYVHTLKGDSASMGFSSLSEAAHRLEDILHMLREEKMSMDKGIGDILLTFIDLSSQILTNSKEGNGKGIDTKGLIEGIDKCLRHVQAGQTATTADRPPVLTEYQRVQIDQAFKNGLSVYEIEAVFDQRCREKEVGAFMIKTQLSNLGEAVCWAPEIEGGGIEDADAIKFIFIAKAEAEAIKNACAIAGITEKVDIRNFSAKDIIEEAVKKKETNKPAALRHDTMLRVDAKRVDEIMNLVGELIIGKSMITQSVYELRDRFGRDEAVSDLENIDAIFERSLSELQKGIMKIRMVPIDHVFRKFPRIIRDLSKEKGKEIRLEVYGADTELDKGIIDIIGEPLIHIVRNCIDHGIEKKEERKDKGKDECGVIRIKACHEGGQIIIGIEDDGKGINIEKVKEKAVEKGIISSEEAEGMNCEDAIDLIFHSGLSTADEVTETSGRGIGMDAVKKTVEDLKGLIQVVSAPDKGARFTIRLPLTLAIIQGMVFSAGGRGFALPLSSILEIRRVFKEEIKTINGMESLKWRGRIISLIRLAEFVGSPSPLSLSSTLSTDRQAQSIPLHLMSGGEGEGERDKSFVIVIGIAEKKLGVLVDKLIGKRELVIKAMDNGSDIVSGASILGDGSIALVLDAAALLKRVVMPAAKATA